MPLSRSSISQKTLLELEAYSKPIYKRHTLDHEDVMVGRSLYNLATAAREGTSAGRPRAKPSPSLYTSLGIAAVADCRYHDVHAGANKRAISERTSVVIHHVRREEYSQLMERFPSLGSDGASDALVPAQVQESTLVTHTVLRLC